MSFIAPNGEKWVSEEVYNGFIHKTHKKQREGTRWRNVNPGPRFGEKKMCERCTIRMACVKAYDERLVCPNCHLSIIEG